MVGEGSDLSKSDITDGNELHRVLARLQGTQTLLHQARDRVVHLRDDASDVLTEIEALLQELYLEANAMAAEGSDRLETADDGQARCELDLDSLLGIANEDDAECA